MLSLTGFVPGVCFILHVDVLGKSLLSNFMLVIDNLSKDMLLNLLKANINFRQSSIVYHCSLKLFSIFFSGLTRKRCYFGSFLFEQREKNHLVIVSIVKNIVS